MTDPNQDCPQGLSLTDYIIRSCGRAHAGHYSCLSTIRFPVGSSDYSHVCGRVTAHRKGNHYAFFGYNRLRYGIDKAYVEGLSLTHGSMQTHIWTFASGWFSGTAGSGHPDSRCPCDPGNFYDPPPFVGSDYFCESVATVDNYDKSSYRFYGDNALWDGQDHMNACYGFNKPPWFKKSLPIPTSDDIELRMCLTNDALDSDIAIELLEIYVQ